MDINLPFYVLSLVKTSALPSCAGNLSFISSYNCHGLCQYKDKSKSKQSKCIGLADAIFTAHNPEIPKSFLNYDFFLFFFIAKPIPCFCKTLCKIESYLP